MPHQTKFCIKFMMEGATIFRSIKGLLFAGIPLSGAIIFCPFSVQKKKAHKDRPTQNRKSTVKLYRLIRNIPREGSIACEKGGTSTK
jgi:hypothetical protein